MSNSYEYAQLFNTMIDDLLIQGLTSGWMTGNATGLRYTGGNTVQIPRVSTTGLGDYTRDGGASSYAAGSVTQVFDPYVFTMDRSAQFTLDAMDNDETAFVVNSSSIIADFNRRNVIPEVDSYRYSTVFDYANLNTKLTSYTPAKATIYSQLKSDLANIEDIVGPGAELIITMSVPALNILEQSTELSRELSSDDLTAGQTSEGKDISVKVKSIDGHPIVKVSSARMKSLYSFTTGFAADANALDVNWLITARNVPIAAVKRDNLKMFDPGTNQQSDGWLMQYRQYHDLWITSEGVSGIWANYTPATAPALSITVAGGSASGTTKFTATAGAGNTLAYKLTAAADTATDLSYGIVVGGTTAYTSGADITATAGQFLNAVEVDSEGKIVKAVVYELQAGDITA